MIIIFAHRHHTTTPSNHLLPFFPLLRDSKNEKANSIFRLDKKKGEKNKKNEERKENKKNEKTKKKKKKKRKQHVSRLI